MERPFRDQPGFGGLNNPSAMNSASFCSVILSKAKDLCTAERSEEILRFTQCFGETKTQ